LCATEADLTGGRALDFDSEAFPTPCRWAASPSQVAYAYSPGEGRDGATVGLGFISRKPFAIVHQIVHAGFARGFGERTAARIAESAAAQLQPFRRRFVEIISELQATGESLQADLARFIRQRYGVEIPLNAWPTGCDSRAPAPAHRSRGQRSKNHRRESRSRRLRQKLEQVKAKPAPDDSAWSRVAQQWERTNITAWNFGSLPARITVSESGPVPTFAWPGLAVEKGTVCPRLFRQRGAGAAREPRRGFHKLIELALAEDFARAWLHRDLRELNRFRRAGGQPASAG
jgi:ATP-dependent helicase HrpA